MKLSEVMPYVAGLLTAAPALAGLEIISNVAPDHNRRLETALRDTGLVLVVVLSAGTSPTPSAPRLLLHNQIMVSVLENPLRNQTGKDCMEITEAVLEALHQAAWPTQSGLQNVIAVDTPAYEAGPLDSGLIITFCNFIVKSIQA